MEKNFKEIEREFHQLSQKFKQKKISEQEYKDRLRKLRLEDTDGKCWTIGARSGKWYYFDGKNWQEATPPSIQEGKAICIYCGYENDLTSMFCAYCGGNLEEEKPIHACPQCGMILQDPDQDCPKCTGKKTTYTSIQEIRAKDIKAEEFIEEEGAPNYVFRSVSPVSMFFLLGFLGLFSGLIFGVFAGTTPYFSGMIKLFPLFLQDLQGKLVGGIAFGLLGGAIGFALVGALGFLLALVFNGICLFFGGLKIHLDKLN
jgi:hypothetical protein